MHGLKFRETNILKIIEESFAVLPPAGNTVITVKSLLEDNSVWIDHEQMVAAFRDLEQNGIESMPDGGHLTITITGNVHQVAVELTDTGTGIPAENIPLLFTPYFTTKPVGDGTGLGLPSAYATIKGHRGDISIESNADPEKGPTGTTVRITLPRRQTFQVKEAKVIVHEEE